MTLRIEIEIETKIEIEIQIETGTEVATAEIATRDETDPIETLATPPASVTITPGMEVTAQGLGHPTITPIILTDVKDPATVESAKRKITAGHLAAKTANRTVIAQVTVTLHPANNVQSHEWAHLVVERHW